MRLAPEAGARGLHTARISTFDMSAGGAAEGPREELGMESRFRAQLADKRLAPTAVSFSKCITLKAAWFLLAMLITEPAISLIPFE